MLLLRFSTLGIKLLTVIVLGLFAQPALAQLVLAQVNAAADGTGTTVNVPIANQVDITNGTRSGNNLFHSFQQFSVGAGQTANFVVPTDVQNVLARVSGGAISVIDGRLQLTGGNSNLYLMNPAGIVFGNNAQLNLPAAFVGTTANGIGFGNGQWFSASGTNNFTQLIGTPKQFAFTENQSGVIVNAGKISTADDQPLALIGGTIVATQYWENNGALALATVEGAQVVELTLPGSQLRLAVKVNPLRPSDSIPNRWTTPIATLPELLTGGDVRNATQISLDGNGRILLIGSNQPLTVQSGDIVVDSIKIFNRLKSGNIYDIWIDAQKTFRALGTVPKEFVNSNDNISLPVSLRSIGKTTINHGGQSFVEAIGYQRDAKGIVIQDPGGRRVLLDGKGGGDPNLPETQVTQFRYEDTGAAFDTDPNNPNARLNTPIDPAFNPSQANPLTSYVKGLVVVQDSEGNGTLLGSLQDSKLSNPNTAQIITLPRPKGQIANQPSILPGDRATSPRQPLPERDCRAASRSRDNTATTCAASPVVETVQSDQILRIIPAK